MSAEYIPKYKSDKVFTGGINNKEVEVRNDARAGKPAGWEFVAQFFSYESWERKDEDFFIFHGVQLLRDIPELNVTEYSTLQDGAVAPNGATVLEVHPATYVECDGQLKLAKPGYVKISQTKTVGPINPGARFDKLYLNKSTKDGILDRTSSKSGFRITLQADLKNPHLPRLLGEYKK